MKWVLGREDKIVNYDAEKAKKINFFCFVFGK